MAQEIIRFSNVHFQYPGTTNAVINDCSFVINHGERAVIKGASGTGKTTIFRLIFGFENPDKGSVLYKGNACTNDTIRDLRRHSAWLPQDLNLGSGTVHEIILFPFQFSNNAHSQLNTHRISTVFERLGLESSLLESDFTDLSTGQRQRVGIALCYLLDKPLILLDEPTSALDEHSKERIVDLLFEDKTRTILSTSHDPWWIERCDSIIELN